MRIERRLGIRSAYGQLVLIVFLPIAILAMVGGALVFFETTRAIKSEQDALAQAALIRYEPIIRTLLPTLGKEDFDNNALLDEMDKFANTTTTNALLPQTTNQTPATNKTTQKNGERYTRQQLQRIGADHRVLRVAILDEFGTPIMSVGHHKQLAWGTFNTNDEHVWRLKTAHGTAYGVAIMANIHEKPTKYWLFVDMDNEPIVIAYYRIGLALIVTGLTTILLLLLILSLYSKRWIAPIYELRLFLQRLRPNTLDQTLNLRIDGEFSLLQAEINRALKKMHANFQELKAHSEQTEADLQQAFDEMEMQTISIRRVNSLLKHNSDAKSAFLASISHELRTPLNAIDGFINLLSRSDNLDHKQALYVQTIKKSSAHLLALINDVLDFSKMEAGKLILEQHTFDLYHSVYEVADMLSPTAHDKNLRMAVLYYNDVPTTLIGDKLRVKQILTNLVGNALKFTDTGDIVISVTMTEHDHVRISVTDSGRGIDKSVSGQLFESFSQGDASITRRYGGTGLGLMISKQLTHLMNGEIGFFDNADENIATHGTTFWFELPITINDDELPFGATLPMTGKLLAWMHHGAAEKALKMGLIGTNIQLETTDTLAKLLGKLSNANDYDWVIVDGHAQKGDLTALLGQIRRYYEGQLLIYGYQIGTSATFDDKTYALYEPFDKTQFYQIINHQSPEPVTHRPLWHHKTALIVDDHPANLLVLDALLSEFGIKTIKANSGFDAIEIINQNLAGDILLDLVFMDISMPIMSGLETCQAIRKLENGTPTTKKLPIIALTAHGLPDDDSELIQSGLDDYATKPLAEHDLMQLLQKWLSTPTLTTSQQNNETLLSSSKSQPLAPTKQLPIYDQTDALARVGGKAELADNLLTLLIDGLPNELNALKHAFETNNLSEFSDTIHRTLGASRYTGVPMLRTILERLHNHSLNCKQTHNENWQALLNDDYQALVLAIQQLIEFNKNQQ